MCECCCDCPKNREATEEGKKKDNRKVKIIEKKSLNQSNISNDQFSVVTNNPNYDDIKLENFFFKRPVKNKYSNNDLYSMNIDEINLGILPTMYKKKDGKFEPSFHPFFYLGLENEEEENFGVVVQYLVVPKDAREEQIHLYEEDGVEFIEKPFKEFENETKIIFHTATGIIFNINDFIVKYKSSQFQRMNLGEFFHKAIPEKGVWLQRNLMKLQKTCFEFCMSTIKNIGVKKKKKKAIENTKKCIRKMINKSQNAKYYDKYVQDFERLFDEITEDDN